MTGTGAAAEDVLDSAEGQPKPSKRAWVAVVILALAVAVGLLGFQALQPDPAADRAESTAGATAPEAGAAADPSLVDSSARRLYGELPPQGSRTFSSAVRAANDVVRIHCRPDVPSWAATLISSGDGYDEATFIMSPANRRYGTFVVQVELVWSVDHYSYAVVAGHVERCA